QRICARTDVKVQHRSLITGMVAASAIVPVISLESTVRSAILARYGLVQKARPGFQESKISSSKNFRLSKIKNLSFTESKSLCWLANAQIKPRKVHSNIQCNFLVPMLAWCF